MSAYHSRIVEEFRQHGGTLTGPQIAAVVGFGWRRDIHEMRKAGYLIVEDAAGLFHLDLEELPEPAAEPDGSSSGTGTDPQVEGETPLPLDIEEPRPASPYDPSVEAA